MSLIDAALSYAERGQAVFPVGLDKRPLTEHGFKDATTDEDLVRGYWTRWPEAGIGAAVPEGRIVLDVDPRNGGVETFDALVAKLGPLPATVTARTGGGGWHYHFQWNGAEAPASLGKGIDVKAAGKGYVVLPPSPHASGTPYRWEPYLDPEEQNVVALPEAWSAFRSGSVLNSESDRPRLDVAAVLEGVPEGERDVKLTAYAASMRARGLRREEAEALILQAARACVPKFDEAAALAKVESAWRKLEPRAEAAAQGGYVEAHFRSPAAALREMPDSGGRCATFFPALDKASRGGARAGEIWTFVGGPGAAKSTFMEQIARSFADIHKSPVVAIHADEGDGPASVRLGQMFGLDREKLESKDEAEISALEAETAGLGYLMANPDEATLEAAIGKLRALKAAFPGPPVLLVDTLHTVACSAGDEAKSAKDRAEKIVEVYKQAARQVPALVLVASEAVKSAYASPDPDKRTNALAAAAETRQIAHASSIQIDLSPSATDETVFEAYVPKNRIAGAKPRFSLRLDKAAGSLTEIDGIAVQDERAEKKLSKQTEKISKLAERAEALLKTWPDGLAVTTMLGRLGGRKDDLLAALQGLENQGAATWAIGPRGAHVWKLTRKP